MLIFRSTAISWLSLTFWANQYILLKLILIVYRIIYINGIIWSTLLDWVRLRRMCIFGLELKIFRAHEVQGKIHNIKVYPNIKSISKILIVKNQYLIGGNSTFLFPTFKLWFLSYSLYLPCWIFFNSFVISSFLSFFSAEIIFDLPSIKRFPLLVFFLNLLFYFLCIISYWYRIMLSNLGNVLLRCSLCCWL